MKTGRSLSELAAEIERRSSAKRDFVANVSQVEMVVQDAQASEPKTAQAVALRVGQEQFAVNGIAHDQIGQHCGIPAKYYDACRERFPELLAQNVNAWLHAQNLPSVARGARSNNEPVKRMIRTMDGTARAFLSDKFRPLENEDLAEAVLPVLMDLNLDIMSCEVTDRKFYMKVVDSSITRELGKIGGQWGDGQHNILKLRVASPAITISNSEVGMGALSVLAGAYDGFCSNLASFGERSVRKYHVGAKHELAGDELYSLLSNEARAATDKALWMQIRDVVKVAFDRVKFDQLIDKVEGTINDRIEGDPIECVNLAAKKFGLNETEGKGVLRHLIEGGTLSRFGIYNAITRQAQDVECYDRATELESIGGKVIELARHEWQQIAPLAKAA